MDDEGGRPAKRFKPNADENTLPDMQNDTHNVTKKNISQTKSKTKKFGNIGIFDTIELVPATKKKAISVSELKDIRDQHKNSLSTKKLGSIIEIKDDSDLSTNDHSSPFKIIRSSQDFNFESPVSRRTPQTGKPNETTPTLFRSRPSSDDGIFWITTPRSKRQSMGQNATETSDGVNGNLNKIPSSPLKNDKELRSKDFPDTLLDPELKKLLAKYGNQIQLDGKPFYKRSHSDTRTINDNPDCKDGSKLKNSTQIIARKNSLNDSILDSFNKRSHHLVNTENDKIDLSDMLMKIGSELMGSTLQTQRQLSETTASIFDNILQENKVSGKLDDEGPNNSTNGHASCTKIGESFVTGESLDSQLGDSFSDDIDISALETNATQAVPVGSANNIDDSDDDFSDDDDDIMEKIELGLTQSLVQTSRPNTDQTDITNAMETMDIGIAVAKENKLDTHNVQNFNTTAKFKGLITKENEINANKPFQIFDENDNLAKSAIQSDDMMRLQIKNVHKGVFKRDMASHKQYILKCITSEDKFLNVMVRDHWVSLDFKINDVIHVIITKPGANFQLVDKFQNLLIWHPDTLLSATRIADAVECKRRSIINQKFNGPGIVSIPFLMGNMVHSLFQKCLIHRCIDDDFADEIIENELDSHIIEIYAAGKNREEIKGMIVEHFSYIKEWIREFLQLKSTNLSNSKYKKNSEFKATNILDVEENILSPIYGIRGLIDVVIEAKLNNGNKFVVPLEIKTGKEYLSNRAQVSLYTLLIKQRYKVDSFYTSLVYTKIHQCYLNAVKTNDFNLLVNIRNELSQYLVYGITELPQILQRSSCERCFSIEPCMVLNKLTEKGNAQDSGIEMERYNEITGHLKNSLYEEYYQHWDKLITKEEGLMNFAKSDLWRYSAQYRENNGGYCVGNLKIVSCDFNAVANLYIYMFERDSSIYPPLTSSQLAKNDRIILSDEESSFGLTWGWIRYLRSDVIVITSDRNWTNSAVRTADFNSETNQTFRSVLRTKTVDDENDSLKSSQILNNYITSRSFRIDKDQMFHGMSMARYNLLNLFLPDGDSKTCELIVELRAPKFCDTPLFEYQTELLKMNEDQMKAIELASKMEDYCLILGMPGTGKTTIISNIIDCMIKSGKTVLISSYTHSAVDNICEKLINNANKRGEQLPLLRAGSPARINTIVKPYSLYSEEFNNKIGDKIEFANLLDNCQIVATTCLGINDVIFGMNKRFDYCIIDEASQVALPLVLGPLSFSDKFILVGDHYQLPPLVLHPEAKQEGLDKSLFKILSDAHPSSVVELTHQYRMCSDIMSLSNELIYNGRLKCGSEDVANQKLVIPYLESIPVNDTCIKEILNAERRVLFVNEDAIDSLKEVSIADKIDNPGEAKLITNLIKVMILGGIKQENIGVMSFYKAQLRHFFASLSIYNDIEILTADRFQGRDKDVIIISLVRSETIGDLLKEWRRVNVAMTRAKCKLIIFGSKKLLRSVEQFEGFMEMIESNGWCYDLKKGDEKVINELNFLGDDGKNGQVNGNEPNHDDSQSRMGLGVNSTQVKRLDRESKLIRKSKILKFVIDDITSR